MSVGPEPLHVWVIAGEASGDALGAGLMAGLRRQHAGTVRFSGIGGPQMQREGLDSLFPHEELSVMGLAEVVPKVYGIWQRVRQTVTAIKAARPDVVVTIDAKGFAESVAKRLRGADFPLVHYIAPTVWAWRPKRAEKYQRLFDHLLAIFPFEPPLFEAVGLPCTFVGNPVTEGTAAGGDGAAFRARYEIPQHELQVCVLPGSRTGEIRRLMPVFGEALAILGEEFPGTRLVIPALPAVEARIREEAKKWRVPARIVPALEDRYDAMAASDVALAASGTVALELAAARLPTVIAYKLSPLTVWLARRLIKVRYANMVNILLDRRAVPEFLQGDATPEALEAALERLISSEEVRREVLAAQDKAIKMLAAPAESGARTPSEYAAMQVLKVVADWRGRRPGAA